MNTQNSKKKYLSDAEVFHFFEQLGTLMGAGITPYAALKIMREDAEQQHLSALFDGLGERVSAGRPLSEAIAESGAFPVYVTELLQIGEQTGRVEDVCRALSRYYEDEDSLRDSIKSAVAYPIIMISMMAVVIIVLLRRVLPVFAQVFRQLGARMNGITELLIRASESLSRYYLVFAVLLVLLVLLFLYCFATKSGQEHFRRFGSSFPLTRRFFERLAVTRFVGGMQMTISAGLDAYTSLEMTSRLADNTAVRTKIEKCKELLLQGESFSGAMEQVEMFDPFYISMLKVFAEAGSIDRALMFIGEHYKESTDRRITRTLAAIEPTLVAVLSLIVGMILLSVILPLIGIMSNIG